MLNFVPKISYALLILLNSFLFLLFCLGAFFYFVSKSLIQYSAPSNLLFIPSSVLFISDIAFFISDCTFYDFLVFFHAVEYPYNHYYELSI